MFPVDFEYHRPDSLEGALALLQRYGEDAKVLAGGHSLLPAMRLRLARPRVVVDIGRIPGLSYIRAEGENIAIGALTTHAEIEASALLAERASALAGAARVLGDVQVRNRGTIGGALAHADPAADYPAALLALGGHVVIAGPGGERTVALDEFFCGPFTTALLPGEILTGVRVPAAMPGTGSAYIKFTRRASDYGYVGVAASVTLAPDGTCRAARVGVTCVGPCAYRAAATEAALVGQRLTEEVIAAAAAHVTRGVDIADDPYVPAAYRAHLATVVARRAIAAARDRALAGLERGDAHAD